MSEFYVKLELEHPAVGRSMAFGSEDIEISATKEVGFGIYERGQKKNKTEKEQDVLVAYISQQEIVAAFVEIVKLSSILEMLNSGLQKGNSFDYLITTALREMDAAVDFKKK